MPNYHSVPHDPNPRSRARHAPYGRDRVPTRHVVHALISRSGPWSSAECLEIAVVTQGRTVDETIANLRDAVSLHIEGEDVAAMGLAAPLTLAVTFEEPIGRDAASSKA